MLFALAVVAAVGASCGGGDDDATDAAAAGTPPGRAVLGGEEGANALERVGGRDGGPPDGDGIFTHGGTPLNHGLHG